MKTLLSRRALLRAGGIAIGLPLLDAMIPLRAHLADTSPRRMVLIHRPLGTYHPFLYPEQAGSAYVAPRYLKTLERHRGHYTVFSGIAHLGYPNSHHTESAIFTGVHADGLARADDIHNSVSLDQVVAEQVGGATRVRSLTLGGANCASLSWNRKGIPIPWGPNRAGLFRQLFINGTPAEVEQELARLAQGRSILDQTREQLRDMARRVSASDRRRLDLLATSIREAETLLAQDEAWARKPKPPVTSSVDQFERAEHFVAAQEQWYALLHLALQTDSTRVIVLGLGEQGQNNLPDLSLGHHDASHHGKDPAKIEQFARYEEKEYAAWSTFLDRLATTDEGGQTLLERTQVLLASNLGDASAHASANLPVLLAGGGFQHLGHIAFNQNQNTPLSNLFLRMLHQMGIPSDRFGSSTGIITELG